MVMKLDQYEKINLFFSTADGGIFEVMSTEFRRTEQVLSRKTFTFTGFVLFLTHFKK